MKLGLALPSFVRDPTVPIAVARGADAAGVDGVFVYDHLFRGSPDGSRRPALEGVALLGALAQATTACAVGALVFRAWLRPPRSLAAAIATVERIAPGRVIATIGAGDSQSRAENESFGLGFGTTAERVAVLRAAVRAARETNARIWVGGELEAVRAVAAEHAHGWNKWGGDATTFASEAGALRDAASRPGFECTWGGLVVAGDDDREAEEKADRLGASPGTIVGGPATIARALQRYRDAGADWAILAPIDSSDVTNARLVGEQVRPLVAG